VQTVDADRLCLMLSKLVTSTFIELGNVVLWQKIGIPMGTNCAPFLANLYCFAHELAFLRSLLHSHQARTPGFREYRLIRGMHETTRYIDDLLTLNFPEFEQVMYRRVDEVDPPPVLALYFQVSTLVGSSSRKLTQMTTSKQAKPRQNPLPRKLLTVSKLRASSSSGSSQNQIRIWCARIRSIT